jgi:hypothetical protein
MEIEFLSLYPSITPTIVADIRDAKVPPSNARIP